MLVFDTRSAMDSVAISSVHTSTLLRARTIRLPSRSQESWPDPLDSICRPAEIYMETKRKKFWCVMGPARDAYETIQNRIRESLRDRDDLYRGQDESYVPHTIQCLMVGRTPETSRPYLVISCHEKTLYRNVKTIIERCEWWTPFLDEHPGFGGFKFIKLKHGPRRIADGEGDNSEYYIYTTDRVKTFYGALVFSGSANDSSPCQAKTGGVLYLDDQPFALTAAHPFSSKQDDLINSWPRHTGGTKSFMGDVGEGSSSGSDSSSDLLDEPSILSPRSHFLEGQPKLVGKIAYRSSGAATDELDWALVELAGTSQMTEMLSNTSKTMAFTSNLRTAVRDDIPRPFKVAHPGAVGVSVFTTDRNSNLVSGWISPSETLVCFPGALQYLSLHVVKFCEQLAPGDCGQWIFDSEGNWYGHIVGGVPQTGIAYMSSAVSIVNDIQASTRAKLVSLYDPKEHMETPAPRSNVQYAEFGESPESAAATQDRRFPSVESNREGSRHTIQATADDLDEGNVFSRSQGQRSTIERSIKAGEAEIELSDKERAQMLFETLAYTLYTASWGGHKEVVQILLDKGAEVNAQGGYYGNALQAASQGGHKEVVQILLDKGAEVNAQEGLYGNALQAASRDGYKEVVQILLEKGAEVNAQGGFHGNALQAASQGGYKEIVQILLEKGAEVNAQGGTHGNALQAASWGGYKEIVQILLDKGAEVNAQGGDFGNALQAASEGGHKEVVQILLDKGAEVNAQGGYYGNALQAASEGGHEEVVQILLDKGAKVNA